MFKMIRVANAVGPIANVTIATIDPLLGITLHELSNHNANGNIKAVATSINAVIIGKRATPVRLLVTMALIA